MTQVLEPGFKPAVCCARSLSLPPSKPLTTRLELHDCELANVMGVSRLQI